jgi:ribonuclease J
MPVHGEYRHLKAHADLALELGIPKDNIFLLENGDALEIAQKRPQIKREEAPAGEVLVDGLGVGDVGSIVLRDRKILSESGLIIVVASVDRATKRVVSGPDLISRGFVYVRENEDLLAKAQHIAEKSLERCEDKGIKDWNNMKNEVRDDLRRFIMERTGRRPVILPIFMEV